EPEEARGVGQEPARAGVLDDRRLAAGQVAEGPVADPGILEPDARGLRAAELPPRGTDVVAVAPGGGRDRVGVADAPAPRLERATLLLLVRLEAKLLVGPEAERQLQRRADPARQVQERDEARPLVV